VELDATDPQDPRVTRATVAVDVGRAINPRGLEAQMLGGLTDAIGTTLRAGLHIVEGLPLEGSYSQFHYTRQADSPTDVRVFVIDSSDEPAGAGELGVPAAVGAIANAYARATGTTPRSFPIVFPVDFEPFPR
jgi:isoquinoline 1-oxidoreductase beta subunit